MTPSQHTNPHTSGSPKSALGKGLVVVIILVALAVGTAVMALRSCEAGVGASGKTTITPTQITRIRSIGEWEFLSISNEELVDTVRRGFFGDDELSRIYYGTLRLGIDLDEVADNWITMDHDTVTVLLPPIKLLDNHFIDEARTQAFYEEGKWSEADKAKLTAKAVAAMKKRCLTPENISSAEQNASTQFDVLLRSMGFEFTKVRFSKSPDSPNKK